jgi:hypothetical protein
VVLLKESKLIWEKKINSNEELENSKQAFLYKAEEILSLLSISERDRIDWHRVSFHTTTVNRRMPVFESEILSEIRANNLKFTFTDLRNKYVHSGFDVFSGQYQYALKQRRIMRALTERLLLNRLGINYKDTHLGNVDL